MPSSFPIVLDIIAPDYVATDLATGHAALHTRINNAVRAIEAKIGIDGSVVTSTLDYLLKAAVDPGHTHTSATVGLANVTNHKQVKAYNAAATVVGWVPVWNSITGDALGVGFPVAETGNNTIIKTTSSGGLNPALTSLFGTPAGLVTSYAGSTAPTGWLLCDGSAISRVTYASLFAVIATQYGAGDGSTTFNVPNVKGRIPVGLDGAQTEFDILGETGGAKTHLLTAAESGLPAHSHSINNLLVSPGTGSSGPYGGGGGTPSSTSTAGPANASSPHNNLQPYIVFNYIIKV